jgi:hypothetical protein
MFNTTTKIYLLAAIILALAGTGGIVSSGFVDPVAMRVGLELGGVGLLGLGLLAFRLGQAEARAEERHRELLAKLDELKEELKNQEEKPRNSGVAIADIFGTGLKWYSDYVTRNKEEQEKGPDA